VVVVGVWLVAKVLAELQLGGEAADSALSDGPDAA
jgi:hypothetical protein